MATTVDGRADPLQRGVGRRAGRSAALGICCSVERSNGLLCWRPGVGHGEPESGQLLGQTLVVWSVELVQTASLGGEHALMCWRLVHRIISAAQCPLHRRMAVKEILTAPV